MQSPPPEPEPETNTLQSADVLPNDLRLSLIDFIDDTEMKNYDFSVVDPLYLMQDSFRVKEDEREDVSISVLWKTTVRESAERTERVASRQPWGVYQD
jgi:hypothetical protein